MEDLTLSGCGISMQLIPHLVAQLLLLRLAVLMMSFARDAQAKALVVIIALLDVTDICMARLCVH